MADSASRVQAMDVEVEAEGIFILWLMLLAGAEPGRYNLMQPAHTEDPCHEPHAASCVGRRVVSRVGRRRCGRAAEGRRQGQGERSTSEDHAEGAADDQHGAVPCGA